MNREIKFRIWSKINNSWVTDSTIDTLSVSDDLLNHVFCNRNLVFQQFTGARDCDGMEIYEGDIVTYRGKTGVIEFFATMFVCSWDSQMDDELAYMMIADIKVIGNIFER